MLSSTYISARCSMYIMVLHFMLCLHGIFLRINRPCDDGEQCDPPYSYRHHLNLTGDANAFRVIVKLAVCLCLVSWLRLLTLGSC